MKIISCVGAKGGTGKSSVSLLLAWELAKQKYKCAIIDADIQGSCISAAKINDQMPFDVISCISKESLWKTGKQLIKENYDYLIIDGNPRSIHEDVELILMIAKLSDLNLVITRPSPRDIKAQIKYVENIKQITEGHIKILWNFYQKTTYSHKNCIPQSEELLKLNSITTRIALRICYQDIGFDEDYIGNFANKEALNEIRKLTEEVKELLNDEKTQ